MEREKNKKPLLELMREIDEMEDVKTLIKDNKIEFFHKNNTFRLCSPTYGQKIKIRKLRNKKYYEMLDNPAYLTKEDLMKKLKAKGQDINKIDTQLIELKRKEEEISIRALKEKVKKEREKLLIECIKLREDFAELSRKKRDLLDSCIEVELKEFVDLQFIAELLEIKEKESYRKYFKDFEELMNCEDEQLLYKSNYFLQVLVANIGVSNV